MTIGQWNALSISDKITHKLTTAQLPLTEQSRQEINELLAIQHKTK